MGHGISELVSQWIISLGFFAGKQTPVTNQESHFSYVPSKY